MFQALYKKIHCDFHIYNPGVISLVSHWKLGFQASRNEVLHGQGKHMPWSWKEAKKSTRNQHFSRFSWCSEKDVLAKSKNISIKPKSHYPPISHECWWNIPPPLFSTRKTNDTMVLVKYPSPTPSPTAPICISINASPPMDRTRLRDDSETQMDAKLETPKKFQMSKKKYPPKV